jgi:heme oxygenase
MGTGMSEAGDVGRPAGRWQRLKTGTEAAHERLDKRIMAAAPFASRERYGLFVSVQHAFHRDIDALYARPELQALFTDLAGRRRLPLIQQDLVDLGAANDVAATAPAAGQLDTPAAIGWLYVAEGSNLGAAFLLKAAARLGLDETFGARHLAAAPEGRGLSWRNFTTALDAVQLSDAEEARLVEGARAAFHRVHDLVEATMPLPSKTADLAPA